MPTPKLIDAIRSVLIEKKPFFAMASHGELLVSMNSDQSYSFFINEKKVFEVQDWNGIPHLKLEKIAAYEWDLLAKLYAVEALQIIFKAADQRIDVEMRNFGIYIHGEALINNNSQVLTINSSNLNQLLQDKLVEDGITVNNRMGIEHKVLFNKQRSMKM